MKSVFLSLGGNLKNSKDIFHQIISEIEKKIGIISKKSQIYKTQAWGNENQSDFLNQVMRVETSINSAEEVLKIILKLELEFGRIRKEKWGPRAIDIDILFYDDEIIQQENLVIPHPYIQDRNFILIPMIEIEKSFVHPLFKKTLEKLLEENKDEKNVSVLS